MPYLIGLIQIDIAAARTERGQHMVLLLGQTRAQLSRQFVALITITIKPVLPNCPRRDLVETVWQFLRGTCLSSRVDFSY